MRHYNQYVSAYCRAEMYAGRIACCPLVSHSECRQDRPMDGRQILRFLLHAASIIIHYSNMIWLQWLLEPRGSLKIICPFAAQTTRSQWVRTRNMWTSLQFQDGVYQWGSFDLEIWHMTSKAYYLCCSTWKWHIYKVYVAALMLLNSVRYADFVTWGPIYKES